MCIRNAGHNDDRRSNTVWLDGVDVFGNGAFDTAIYFCGGAIGQPTGDRRRATEASA